MRKQFFYAVVSSMTVVGSVIGAGFITGKEIFEFFAFDLSWAGIYVAALLFTAMIYLIGSVKINQKLSSAVGIFVALANIIVSSCMLSALYKLYSDLFCVSENFKILSVITAILLFIMTLDGIGLAERFNAIFIPFTVVAVIVVCLSYKGEMISPSLSPMTPKGAFNPIIYVGFNVILSFSIIKNSGEKLSPPFKLLSAVLTAVILCACIFFISRIVALSDKSALMPLRDAFFDNVILLKIIEIIMLFAIYSTLISSLYTVSYFGGIRLNVRLKLLLLCVIIAISEIGFSAIVERLYPQIGIAGYAVIVAICLLRENAQGLQRGRTCHRPERIK